MLSEEQGSRDGHSEYNRREDKLPTPHGDESCNIQILASFVGGGLHESKRTIAPKTT